MNFYLDRELSNIQTAIDILDDWFKTNVSFLETYQLREIEVPNKLKAYPEQFIALELQRYNRLLYGGDIRSTNVIAAVKAFFDHVTQFPTRSMEETTLLLITSVMFSLNTLTEEDKKKTVVELVKFKLELAKEEILQHYIYKKRNTE